MTGQTSQFDLQNALEAYNSLSFELGNGVGEEVSRLPVEVKNLTTAGVILEILHLHNGLKIESLKGREGLLKIIAQDESVMLEVPGKILWTHNRDGDTEATLGLELRGPLPLPVRQMLEATMSIGAKDMKVLWDYWDEIQEAATVTDLPEQVRSVPESLDKGAANEERVNITGRDGWWYWAGFGAIILGLAMQLPQSESLGFSGLMVMFLGSMIVAWKSIMSLRQTSASGQPE